MVSNEIMRFSHTIYINLPITLHPFLLIFLNIMFEFLTSKTIGVQHFSNISLVEDELMSNK